MKSDFSEIQILYSQISLQILEYLPTDYSQHFRHRWSQSQAIVSSYLLAHLTCHFQMLNLVHVQVVRTVYFALIVSSVRM